MTIEELADLHSDELAKLTTTQLEEVLKPYFNVTRPELAPKSVKGMRQETQVYLSPQKRAALAALQDEGIDLSFLNKRKKK